MSNPQDPVNTLPVTPPPKGVSSDDLILENLDDATNDTIDETAPPSVLGEQAVSGEMPDPESDDDTLEMQREVGTDRSDYDDQQPLNTAKSVEEAEELHRSS